VSLPSCASRPSRRSSPSWHESDAAPKRREPPPGLTVAAARDLERQLVDDHYSRWIDEPLETLGGCTPRQAAGSGAHDEL
jgi:hypothetical protein